MSAARGSGVLLALGWSFLGVLAGLGLARAFAPHPPAPAPSTGVAPAPSAALEPAPAPVAATTAADDERVALRAECDALRERLARAERERVEREEEFLRYAEMITAITPPELPPEIVQALGGEVPESSLPQEDPALVAERARRQARADELASALRALMRVEQFDSLDLLEAGTLGDGWLGPVVFRVVDERGRPSGSLSADRLRLEGSAAGWTLTFVLEGGYERRGGRRVAFEGTQPDEERGGVRRIVLSQTDPAPWYEALPELFGATPPAPRLDDGRWELALVKNGLNALLGADAALGSYRLERLGGVFEDELRAVELTQRDVDGRLLQRLVADRLAIARGERGVVLTLHDGVILKGSRKHAFLDGRYRIFLPRADVPSWEAAGLPGLVPVAESSAAAAPLGLR